MEKKEERIRALTSLYYSNPKVQEAIIKFSKDREIVPRYFEGFGKRPDTLNYPSDIIELVKKGATSFHSSQELWKNVMELNLDLKKEEFDNLRKGWDLLIDVDSQFLDYSKIAAKLIISALEQHGVKNYGLKFSGSKGFHIIVSSKSFPEFFDGCETKNMFPEWPRAISEFLMNWIRRDYNKIAGEISTIESIEKRTKLNKEELSGVICLNCNNKALTGSLLNLKCNVCSLTAERKTTKAYNKKLRCLNNNCSGLMESEKTQEYYFCDECKNPENKNLPLSSDKNPESFEKVTGVSAEKIASLDLVLVASRHLFRMPYSLHEKTSLSSVVISKSDLDSFSPLDAQPLKVKIRDYLNEGELEEAKYLLASALTWKRNEEKFTERKTSNTEKKDFDFKLIGIEEKDFPEPIKKIFLGMEDGKKRALFVLITFLRCLNFPDDYIRTKLIDWNKKNKPPLRDAYLKGQIDWHIKQKRKILPPNYENDSFYRDLGVLDKKPLDKNPLVEAIKNARKSKNIFKY